MGYDRYPPPDDYQEIHHSLCALMFYTVVFHLYVCCKPSAHLWFILSVVMRWLDWPTSEFLGRPGIGLEKENSRPDPQILTKEKLPVTSKATLPE